MKRTGTIAAIAAAITIAGTAAACGGAATAQTPVQRCTTADQNMVNAGLINQSTASIRAYGTPADVKLLNAALKACNSLTPAQARQAAKAVTP